MHHRAAGRPGARVVVLVHGIGSSSQYWSQTARVLAAERQVLSVDLPGFGRSTPVPRALSISEHADALGTFLEEQGARGALLVGHSMGCQVVVDLVRQDPGASRGLVLVGPTADRTARTPLRQGWRLLRSSAREPWALTAVQVRSFLACGPRTYLGTVAPVLADRIEDHLPEVHVPTLLVRGEHDTVAPAAWLEHLADLTPRAATAEIAGAHHVAQWTHPQRLAGLCLAADGGPTAVGPPPTTKAPTCVSAGEGLVDRSWCAAWDSNPEPAD
jgi:pimeloyl-ACP methyl ester carboxylesterase